MLTGTFRISVKTFQFLEPVLAEELRALGASDIEIGRRIVHCTGDQELLYKANYLLRTALRVLVPVHSFPLRHGDELYRRAMKINWQEFLRPDQTFAIDPQVNSPHFNHPHFASLRLKDAIADQFKQEFGSRPDVNTDSPDVQFHLHIDSEKATIALDSSGSSLNQRGYRQAGGKAPLNETLAAGMLLLAGWNGERDFYDPMCGSGTLSIEAYFIARNLPAQINRGNFGFFNWKNFDNALWKSIKQEALANSVPLKVLISASDADTRQLKFARMNMDAAGCLDEIKVEEADFYEVLPRTEEGLLILNPPYGERLDDDQAELMYKRIGDTLKKNWAGCQAWIVSSNIPGIKQVGLKPSRKIDLMNGPLACKFYRFDLYRGSRVKKEATEPAAE